MDPLPIDDVLDDVVRAVVGGRDVVLAAPPGSGKTTRVPAALVDALPGQVVVLQPRRVAARLAARRVAEERGGRLGEEVGYRVRFDDRSGPRTRLHFWTEALLVRRLQDQPDLAGFSVVVFDEFHERSLDADLGLGMVREVQGSLREDLRVVVMSATLDATDLAVRLGATVVTAGGRPYPVEVEYAAGRADEPLVKQVTRAVARELERDGEEGAGGDVLAFLPGVGEIRRTADALSPLLAGRNVDVLPLHGELSAEAQDRAVAAGSRRRVVLATNVAETSLTLDGVRSVVDSGVARVMRRDPGAAVDALRLEPISKSSAEQRAGRAGRQGPGRCVRLYAARAFSGFAAALEPEIERVDLAAALLRLAAWGTRDVETFPWITPPPAGAVDSARRLLVELGAMTDDGAATTLGRRLVVLPTHPRIARVLDEARRVGAGEEAAVMASLATSPRVVRRPDPTAARSDLLVGLDRIMRAREAKFSSSVVHALGLDGRAARTVDREARQLARLAGLGREASCDDETLLRCVAAGFPDRIARRRESGGVRALTAAGFEVELDAASAVRDDLFFVAVDAVAVGRGRTARVRCASAVDPAWLAELFPDRIGREEVVIWNGKRARAEGMRRTTFGALILDESRAGVVDPDRAAALVLEAASHPRQLERLRRDRLGELLPRLDCLREMRPDLDIPPTDDAAIVRAIEQSVPGLTSLEELDHAPLGAALLTAIDAPPKHELDRLVPVTFTLPSGRSARITYREGRPPLLSARMQEWFGTTQTPRLAGGRVPIVLDLLAPNGRSVQITADLANFWETLYPKERRELSRRYPRHSWPEDPRSAMPTSRPKPRRK